MYKKTYIYIFYIKIVVQFQIEILTDMLTDHECRWKKQINVRRLSQATREAVVCAGRVSRPTGSETWRRCAWWDEAQPHQLETIAIYCTTPPINTYKLTIKPQCKSSRYYNCNCVGLTSEISLIVHVWNSDNNKICWIY